jgi:hypothetical protein
MPVTGEDSYAYARCVQCGTPMYLAASIHFCTKCRWYPLCEVCADDHPETCTAAGNNPPYPNAVDRVAYFRKIDQLAEVEETESGAIWGEDSEFEPPCEPDTAGGGGGGSPTPPPPPPVQPPSPPPPRPRVFGKWDEYIRS